MQLEPIDRKEIQMRTSEHHLAPGNEPIVWFARLDTALARGDLQCAAAAQRELAGLGWEVRLKRQQTATTETRETTGHQETTT
jgi:hypothetical protein